MSLLFAFKNFAWLNAPEISYKKMKSAEGNMENIFQVSHFLTYLKRNKKRYALMICSTLASLPKFQYFRRPLYKTQ